MRRDIYRTDGGSERDNLHPGEGIQVQKQRPFAVHGGEANEGGYIPDGCALLYLGEPGREPDAGVDVGRIMASFS